MTSLTLFVGKDKDTFGLQKAKSTKVSNDTLGKKQGRLITKFVCHRDHEHPPFLL